MTAPAAPVDAATVVLLRDAPSGLQTWLLTRRPTLAFAAGMSVYPGGRVDAADATVPLARPARAAEVAERFGVAPDRAHAVLVAAARETFEETGVLFSVPAAPAAGLDTVRAALEAREVGFAAVLAEHGLAVDGDALEPWARWVTPAAEPRRYDTFFFVAAPPPGTEAADVTTESTAAAWVDVATALAAGEGAPALMPPTAVTLRDVARHRRVADVLAAAPGADLAAVQPVLRRGADGVLAVLPDGRTVAMPVPARR